MGPVRRDEDRGSGIRDAPERHHESDDGAPRIPRRSHWRQDPTEQYPDAEISIFYIDIRAPGRLEDFYFASQQDEKLTLIKGKVAKITEDAATGKLEVEAEDTLSGERVTQQVDLGVLATGLVPAGVGEADVQGGLEFDEHGFLADEQPSGGFLAAGCAKRPVDVGASVRDATGAAMKALHSCVE